MIAKIITVTLLLSSSLGLISVSEHSKDKQLLRHV